MKIGDTIAHLRSNEELLQKDIYNKLDLNSSVYSKIENNNRSVTLTELKKIAEILNVTVEECILLSDYDNGQKEFMKTFFESAKNPKDNTYRNELLRYYYDYEKQEIQSLIKLSNYIAIRRMFADKWKEVKKITKKDVNDIEAYLLNRDFYTHYDYVILSNLTPFFDSENILRLFRCAFPIQEQDSRSYKTLVTAANCIIGLISNLIQARRFFQARQLLDFIEDKNNAIVVNDLMYQLDLNYLKNIISYEKSKKRKYSDAISKHIDFLVSIGEVNKAKGYEKEVEAFYKDSETPINPWRGIAATYIYE